MTSKQFFEVFDQIKDDESRIAFMKFARQYGHNYIMESQPDRIIQYFYHSNYSPEIIAETFLECFGEIIICREQIYQQAINRQVPYHFIDYAVTLTDCMHDHMNDSSTDPSIYSNLFTRIYDLTMALEEVGILNANEYPDNFQNLYKLDPIYAEIDNLMLQNHNRINVNTLFQWNIRAN